MVPNAAGMPSKPNRGIKSTIELWTYGLGQDYYIWRRVAGRWRYFMTCAFYIRLRPKTITNVIVTESMLQTSMAVQMYME